MTFGRPARFRLLVKHSLIEFYLDDILIECYSLPQDATGRIGLIGGGEAIGKLRACLATPNDEPRDRRCDRCGACAPASQRPLSQIFE